MCLKVGRDGTTVMGVGDGDVEWRLCRWPAVCDPSSSPDRCVLGGRRRRCALSFACRLLYVGMPVLLSSSTDNPKDIYIPLIPFHNPQRIPKVLPPTCASLPRERITVVASHPPPEVHGFRTPAADDMRMRKRRNPEQTYLQRGCSTPPQVGGFAPEGGD